MWDLSVRNSAGDDSSFALSYRHDRIPLCCWVLLRFGRELCCGCFAPSETEAPVPKSILIVDDNEGIRRAMRSFFETQPELKVCGEAINDLRSRFLSVQSSGYSKPVKLSWGSTDY